MSRTATHWVGLFVAITTACGEDDTKPAGVTLPAAAGSQGIAGNGLAQVGGVSALPIAGAGGTNSLGAAGFNPTLAGAQNSGGSFSSGGAVAAAGSSPINALIQAGRGPIAGAAAIAGKPTTGNGGAAGNPQVGTGGSASGGKPNGGAGGRASSPGGSGGSSSASSRPASGGAGRGGATSSVATGGAARGGNSGIGGALPTAGAAPVATIGNCRIFPADNAWNTDISQFPLRSDSADFINSIGANGRLHADFGTFWEDAPIGIPYVVVPGTQPKVPIEYTDYGDESDPGPYPVPPDAPIEGGPDSDGDRHVLVIDSDACVLYELGRAFPINSGASWEAGAGAIWDLKTNSTRPLGWTSVDAAGLPILPGLVRYDEIVEKKALNHAVRFTVERSQHAFVAPASHYASSATDPTLPPMGLRLRMKASYDCSAYSEEVRIICAGLKRYGMMVADNGSNWYISGSHDPRWNDEALADLGRIPGSAFEVVDTGPVRTSYR